MSTHFDGLIINQFRNSHGVRLLKGLFLEVAINTDNVLYTLRRDDREAEIKGETILLPSIRRLYLETMDPTEYEFANKYFEDYEHWEMVSNSPFLKDHVESWRRELRVKIRSEAYRQLSTEAFLGGKNSFQACKYLFENTTPSKPTKAEQKAQEEIESLAENDKQIMADFHRLGIQAAIAPQNSV